MAVDLISRGAMPGALLTPAMRDLLDRVRRAGQPPLEDLSPAQARQAYAGVAEQLDLPRAPLARVQDLRIPSVGGDLPARLYAPNDETLPVMLYLHGGGFVVGNLETHDSLCRQWALRAQVAVVALDYRLAPEHRFPAAVDDAWQALQWLARHAAQLGLDAARLAVGGDSAGATLAAVSALQARDQGLRLRLQVLITPGTAPDLEHASQHRFAKGFLLERATIEWFFDQYVDTPQRSDWRFAPLLADDLEGLAPAHVCLAECDPLVDEGLAYADRLRTAGVPIELELWRGVTHNFIKLGRRIVQAEAAQEAVARSLRAHLLAP